MSTQSVFISYSHTDSAWVLEFARALKDLNISVWLDEWQVAAGDSVRNALEKGLRNSDAIIAVLAEQDAARPNVFFELGVALGLGKRLIPIVSKDVDSRQIPFDIRTRRYLTRESPDVTARQVAAALRGMPEASLTQSVG
jgi:predicted nucleotide-binding protein